MSYILAINSGPVKRFTKPIRDKLYRAFVRKFPCIACGSAKRVEAAHFGPHGLRQRSGDDTVLPVCFECHQEGPQAYHKIGPEAFARVHTPDIPALQAMFQRFYFLKTGRSVTGKENEERAA